MLKSQTVSLIKFLGKRGVPKNTSHARVPHPLSSSSTLPPSFFSSESSKQESVATLTSTSQLPPRFQMPKLSDAEIDEVNSGGADCAYLC
ncbi:hypothetical protein DASB73_008480 [Starmerella bacillaris]|uniref:Uncharacterized protein n=1 Tax=Starmerella bacillaris TaxID=1247836 RepID=A0AAV5REU7_STABA|nr:hypothetical protein DASB73_008480 [Starmerella bacillaris]